MNVSKFHMNDLRNSSDISNIRGELQSMDGVHAVRVDNLSNTITVEYEDNLTPKELTSAISKYRKDPIKNYNK